MMELTPKTRKTLKMFEPITLPTARSAFLLKAAVAEVTNSGNDVPIATMLSPIKDSDRPKDFAIITLPSTIQSPPK